MRYDADYDNDPAREGEMDMIGWDTKWNPVSQSYTMYERLTHHDDDDRDDGDYPVYYKYNGYRSPIACMLGRR